MDRPLIIATGQALALVAAMMQRAGVATAQDFGETLGVLAATAGEPQSEESQILSVWSKLVAESCQDFEALPPDHEVTAQGSGGAA